MIGKKSFAYAVSIGALTGLGLAVPATASEAPAPISQPRATGIAANSIDSTCRHHSRNYIVKKYYRGPAVYTLRCGTSTWGWKHIKRRHGWNATMDRKISAAIWSGRPNGRGGFSTYTNTCPNYEKFRTIMGTPAARNDLLTAYKVTGVRGAAAC